MDAVSISQALGNLIKNALQHTPSGFRVKVECKVNDGWVETSVYDTGSGIATVDLPFVFERFYRTDPSRQHSNDGPGLDLSIVKQIVDVYQGKVWVESELGVRCVVYFSLPI